MPLRVKRGQTYLFLFHGSQIDTRKNQTGTDHVEHFERFAKEDHCQNDAEYREQMNENAGPGGTNHSYASVPEKVRENRRKDGKITDAPDCGWCEIRPGAAEKFPEIYRKNEHHADDNNHGQKTDGLQHDGVVSQQHGIKSPAEGSGKCPQVAA